MQSEGASGMWEAIDNDRCVIRVSDEMLSQPPDLAATLAHEVAHQILANSNQHQVDGPREDFEWLTDLATAYLGMGIYQANCAMQSRSSSDGAWSYWHARKSGYLPARIMGYAMALRCWVKGEQPHWAYHLTADPASALKQGFKYVTRTNDSIFRPDTWMQPRSTPSLPATIPKIASGPPSQRLCALWDLERFDDVSPALDTLKNCAVDKCPDIREQSLAVLATLGDAAGDLEYELERAAEDSSASVRAQAGWTAAETNQPVEFVCEMLSQLMRDEDKQVILWASSAAASIGTNAAGTIPALLKAANRAIVKCEDAYCEHLFSNLLDLTETPTESIREFYSEFGDTELQQRALQILAEVTEDREASG